MQILKISNFYNIHKAKEKFKKCWGGTYCLTFILFYLFYFTENLMLTEPVFNSEDKIFMSEEERYDRSILVSKKQLEFVKKHNLKPQELGILHRYSKLLVTSFWLRFIGSH